LTIIIYTYSKAIMFKLSTCLLALFVLAISAPHITVASPTLAPQAPPQERWTCCWIICRCGIGEDSVVPAISGGGGVSLTRDQFYNIVVANRQAEGRPVPPLTEITTYFNNADKDGDGILDDAEYQTVLMAK
jgi:hypothetical protein